MKGIEMTLDSFRQDSCVYPSLRQGTPEREGKRDDRGSKRKEAEESIPER
jgi:hypothetical protein